MNRYGDVHCIARKLRNERIRIWKCSERRVSWSVFARGLEIGASSALRDMKIRHCRLKATKLWCVAICAVPTRARVVGMHKGDVSNYKSGGYMVSVEHDRG